MGDHYLEGTVVVSSVSELDDGTFATIKFKPGTHLVEGQHLRFLKLPNVMQEKEENEEMDIALTNEKPSLEMQEKEENEKMDIALTNEKPSLEFREYLKSLRLPPKPHTDTMLSLDDCIVKKILTKKGAKVTEGDRLFILGFKRNGDNDATHKREKVYYDDLDEISSSSSSSNSHPDSDTEYPPTKHKYPPNPFDPVYFTAQNSGTIVEILVEQEQEIKFLQPLLTYESELADNELDSDIEAELLAEFGMCGSQIPWDYGRP